MVQVKNCPERLVADKLPEPFGWADGKCSAPTKIDATGSTAEATLAETFFV
jgi:hypothetical protein